MSQQTKPVFLSDVFQEGDGVQFHSYSSFNTYASICALQYRFRVIDRLPKERVATALVFGGAMDSALRSLDQDLMKGQPPNIPLALENLRFHLEKAFGDKDVPVVSSHGETLEDLYAMGKRMIEHYVSVLPSDEKPVDLPRSFKVPLFNEKGEALPRPLVGVLDRWVKTESGDVGIIDWKTSDKRWPKEKLAKDDQATAYLIGGKEVLGRTPSFFRYDLLLKTKEPAMERYFVERTERTKRRFVRKIQELDKALEAGVFMPNDSSFACGTCPYRNACLKWQD